MCFKENFPDPTSISVCYAVINFLETRQRVVAEGILFEPNSQNGRSPISEETSSISGEAYQVISRNFQELAAEFCLLSSSFPEISAYYISQGLPLCNDIYDLNIYRPKRRLKINRRKRKNKKKKKIKKKGNKKNKFESNKDVGISLTALIFSDITANNYITSMYHPWQCSMRLQGFRGRHKCGVTLLSGPTEKSPSDPFVLVGAAHCNYIWTRPLELWWRLVAVDPTLWRDPVRVRKRINQTRPLPEYRITESILR